jgi:Na+/phosphate symporter
MKHRGRWVALGALLLLLGGVILYLWTNKLAADAVGIALMGVGAVAISTGTTDTTGE